VGCSSLNISQANPNIAFMGDSITAFWPLPKSNFGIPGNTTAQMLARFPGDVPGHEYRVVVILGGTNDIRNTSYSIQSEIDTAVSDIGQMAAIAEKGNILVVLCKIPPIANQDPRVVPFNAAIEEYAQKHNYKLVDYYAPMAGHPEYFTDGIHPNVEGYSVMQTALTQVIPLDY
jgi:lysophospholipase L1-like esterase